MTQPDRPDRAAAELRNTDRVAAALRHAAASYEPDGERIRRLMDARASGLGGSSVPRRPEARGVRGRTVLWPVLGSAAAAAVIVGVAASGATMEGRGDQGQHPVGPFETSMPMGGDPSGRATTAPPLPSATSTTLPSPGVVSRSGSPDPTPSTSTSAGSGSGAGSTAAPGRGGIPHPGSGHGTAAPTAARPPGPGGPGGTQISGTSGLHTVSASARPLPGGHEVPLGAAGTHWTVASTQTGQPHDVTNGTQLGPVQPLASGASVRTSPFRVRWSGGSPATGTASTWLVTPSGPGTGKGLRIPVRYHALPATVTLYVGTVDGGGQVQIALDGRIVPLDLPSCAGTCAAEVTVTVTAATASAPATGDVTLDVVPTASSQVGIAAAVLR